MSLKSSRYQFLIVLLLGTIGCQRAQPIPGVVEGASMAPGWLGEHRLLICKDCRYPIRFDCDQTKNPPQEIVCPNCGFPANHLADACQVNGHQVAIHYARPISRWDVVASRLPNSKRFGIKRVVGMPGECVEIRGGDLFVNQLKLVKPWTVQKEVRIPLYDSDYRSRSKSDAERWTIENAGGSKNAGWQDRDRGWSFSEHDSSADVSEASALKVKTDWSWLKYHHWRCCKHTGTRQDGFSFEDVDAFNPATTRSLNTTADYCVEIEFQIASDGELACLCSYGERELEFQVDLYKRQLAFELSGDADSKPVLISLPETSIKSSGTQRLEVSTFDQRLLIHFNGHKLLDQPLQTAESKTSTEPISIGARRGAIEIKRVRIWRDVYYLPVSESQFSVPMGSYFLLGDNVPVSVDSRYWKPAAVERSNILGVVSRANE